MNRSVVAFGVFSVIVGVVSGYFMVKHPEGLNPEWPLGMALLAPAAFTLGGLHMIGTGLDRPRLASAMILATVFCLLAVANFAAFFTDHFQCRGTLSFLGVPVVRWYPSEAECRSSLRILMAGFDSFIAFLIGGSVWYRYRAPRREPGR